MKSKLQSLICSAALLVSCTVVAQAAGTIIVVDENGHGTINGAALASTTTGTDSSAPPHTNVLTYGPMGFNGVAGSVETFVGATASTPRSALIRFNGDGTIRFYAAPGVGVNDSSAATKSMPAIFPFPMQNTLSFFSVGSLLSYTPAVGQAGYDATATPTYIFMFSNSTAPTGLINPTGSNLEDAFQVEYVSNLNMADSVVNITNAGSSANVTTAAATGAGAICANVYVYQANAALLACCSCPVVANSLNSLPVIFGQSALLAKASAQPSSVVIKMLATTPTAGGMCDATFKNAPYTLATGLSARGTRSHRTPTTDVTLTETLFQRKALSTGEAQKLQADCSALGAAGQCPACTSGGLAIPASF